MPGLPSCTAGHEAGGTVLLRDLCTDERIRSCMLKRAQSVSTCSLLQCQKSKPHPAVTSALCYPQPNTVKLQQHHRMSPFHFQSREEPEPLAELIGVSVFSDNLTSVYFFSLMTQIPEHMLITVIYSLSSFGLLCHVIAILLKSQAF